MLANFAALAQFERDRIAERTREAITSGLRAESRAGRGIVEDDPPLASVETTRELSASDDDAVLDAEIVEPAPDDAELGASLDGRSGGEKPEHRPRVVWPSRAEACTH